MSYVQHCQIFCKLQNPLWTTNKMILNFVVVIKALVMFFFDDEDDIGVCGDDGDDRGDVGDACDDGGGRDKEGGC